MARLGLKNYQNPQFAIPTIAPDQRPLNQLSKFAQWLHSVYDWKVDDKKDKDTATTDESMTEVPTDSTYNRSYSEPKSEEPVEKEGDGDIGFDPASETAAEADAAGNFAGTGGSAAFDAALKAREAKLKEMTNALAIASSGEPTLEAQKFSGLEGKDLDSRGGPKSQKALWNKLYEDGGTGADKLTRAEPEYFGWATEEFDPAIIGR